jgi:hypothetical protein
MTDPTPSPTNLERLEQQLPKDSLAARLVSAQITAAPSQQPAALKKVISDRLNELKQGHAGTADQKN